MQATPSLSKTPVEGTDFNVYSKAGVSQTGFTLSSESSVTGTRTFRFNAAKSSHGLTNPVIQIQPASTLMLLANL